MRPKPAAATLLMTLSVPLWPTASKAGERGEARRFRKRGAAKTNPMGLRYAIAIGYENSSQNKPNSVNFLAVYWLRRKSVRFSENMNANDPSRIPLCPRCSPHPPSITAGWNPRAEIQRLSTCEENCSWRQVRDLFTVPQLKAARRARVHLFFDIRRLVGRGR